MLVIATCGFLQVDAQRFSSRGLTFRNPETDWIDSVMSTLTLEQRVAQLMVVRVPLNLTDKQLRAFSEEVNGYGVVSSPAQPSGRFL